jgi:hypothetical protein
MQGAIKFHNRPQAMPEVFAQELLFVLANSNDVEQVVTDNNIYFQKLWIYPGKGVATGKLTANGANIYVGKSGPALSFTPAQVTFEGSVAIATQTAHGLIEGDSIKITGATPNAYNLNVARVFQVTANEFRYQLAAQPSGPVTVLPTIARVQFCADLIAPADLPIKFELPLGQKMRLSQVIVTGTAGDGVYLQWT